MVPPLILLPVLGVLLCTAYEQRCRDICSAYAVHISRHRCSYAVQSKTYEQRCRDICSAKEVAVADNGTISQQPNKDSTNLTSIRITIYHAQTNDYPTTQEDWDSYNGIIIPGSLSAAYDTHIEWIYKLQTIILLQSKENVWEFAYQCFAHSFELIEKSSDTSNHSSGSKHQRRGSASKCTIGNIAGRRSFKLTNEGKFLLGTSGGSSNKDCIDMLFTRGDMVESLPSV